MQAIANNNLSLKYENSVLNEINDNSKPKLFGSKFKNNEHVSTLKRLKNLSD